VTRVVANEGDDDDDDGGGGGGGDDDVTPHNDGCIDICTIACRVSAATAARLTRCIYRRGARSSETATR
jgi:hypothetical protein